MSLFEILLAISGVIATIIIGIIGIIYALKYRNKVKLTYFEEGCIPLFETLTEKINEIEVNYKGVPVSPSIVLLKASILNSGNIDIDKSIIHKPLSLQLPSSCKWLEVKTTDFSKDIRLEYDIKDYSLLEFRWDLLKKDEFIRFNALIEVSTEDDISSSLKFIQRITNLRKIVTCPPTLLHM